MMTKSVIIVTALHHCSVPTQPVAHPTNVCQEAACEKGNQLWGLHNFRSQCIKKAFVTLGCGGESGTKVASVCCVMGVALGDQTILVGGAQTFKTNWLPSGKAIQWMTPAPCLSVSFCLIFSGVPICGRLHSCDDYSIMHPLTLMMYRLSKAQLFYNVPKLIPRAFLGRGREPWHMDQIWWFVWNRSAEFLPPLPLLDS